jgi:hypothetical protein
MKRHGVLLEAMTIIGVGQLPDLCQRASDGDSDAAVVMTCLANWSERHREKVPTCIDCDRGMGPLNIAAYAVIHDDSSDIAVVTPICMVCGDKLNDPHAVQTAVIKGLRRRGIKVLKLPDAGHA